MQYDPDCKPELAASKDKFRPGMQSVFLDGGKLIATDGKIMAIIPVEVTEGEPDKVLIPAEAIKDARKASGTLHPTVVLNGEARLLNGQTFPLDKENTFPKWESVRPESFNAFTVALDVKLLKRLADAIGAEVVKIEFSGPKRAARVTNNTGRSDAEGLIMPCKPLEDK